MPDRADRSGGPHPAPGIVINAQRAARSTPRRPPHHHDFGGRHELGASAFPKGWLCVWSGKNFTGRMQKVKYNNKDLSRYAVFAGAWSGYNHGRKCDVALYAGKNYTQYIGTQKLGTKGNANHKLKILSNKWVNCR
ncbi:peptidase inhibitor family I36 protein [Streptomyces sp. MZ04]|uniref:peptidase inhibitor family I36 protein n=1 Tax=Streptomyces sp. MZ04 TaxID=2559236 RepID=UPI001FD8047B|nr:peptidase inhibitor family I36 protein [Streptomyces sp. MZ04]